MLLAATSRYVSRHTGYGQFLAILLHWPSILATLYCRAAGIPVQSRGAFSTDALPQQYEVDHRQYRSPTHVSAGGLLRRLLGDGHLGRGCVLGSGLRVEGVGNVDAGRRLVRMVARVAGRRYWHQSHNISANAIKFCSSTLIDAVSAIWTSPRRSTICNCCALAFYHDT